MPHSVESVKEHVVNARTLIWSALHQTENPPKVDIPTAALEQRAEIIADLRAADARLETASNMLALSGGGGTYHSADEIDYLACVLSRFSPKDWAATPRHLRLVWESRAQYVLNTLDALRHAA